MSDVEQETLMRLAERQAFRVHIVDWGWHNAPQVLVGDHRLSLQFTMTFNKPEIPQPCHYFDLQLYASGIKVFQERQTLIYGGRPQVIGAGLQLTLAWDIAIAHIDPKLVKAVVGATGLTSRLQDKDTGEMTLFGNTKMSATDRHELVKMRESEKRVRLATAMAARKTEK
tara:strand:+ start:196 stop:705 length:510 start_codon:yes stop_codon:yes gene_type:complete